MTRDEAKDILRRYRPGTADAEDPQIAAALALAQGDPDLAGWLEQQGARHSVIGRQFRQIAVPAGLKEQILSEHAAQQKTFLRRPRLVLAAAATIMLLGMLALLIFSSRKREDTLAVYQQQMVSVALRGYAMDLTTNAPAPIRAYLAQNHAPADFVLPAALQQAALTGCAVEGWQNSKVAMICFRTTAAGPSDLWLFVVARGAVPDAPANALPHFSRINRLTTATWTQGDKIYLLGTEADVRTLKQYL